MASAAAAGRSGLLAMDPSPSVASPRASDESARSGEELDPDQDQTSPLRSDSDESEPESPGTLHIDEPTAVDRSRDPVPDRDMRS